MSTWPALAVKGEHNAEVLASLGYDTDTIETLRAAGTLES